MDSFNPMMLFDKTIPPQRLAYLQGLNVLLGGLGQPPAQPISPSLGAAPPKQEVSKERPILGGVANG